MRCLKKQDIGANSQAVRFWYSVSVRIRAKVSIDKWWIKPDSRWDGFWLLGYMWYTAILAKTCNKWAMHRLEALIKTGVIHSKRRDLKVETSVDESAAIYSYMEGGTNFENQKLKWANARTT